MPLVGLVFAGVGLIEVLSSFFLSFFFLVGRGCWLSFVGPRSACIDCIEIGGGRVTAIPQRLMD